MARLKIHDGKLDAFKCLAAQCAELVRTNDTGTLQYEMYINSDNTEAGGICSAALSRGFVVLS